MQTDACHCLCVQDEDETPDDAEGSNKEASATPEPQGTAAGKTGRTKGRSSKGGEASGIGADVSEEVGAETATLRKELWFEQCHDSVAINPLAACVIAPHL